MASLRLVYAFHELIETCVVHYQRPIIIAATLLGLIYFGYQYQSNHTQQQALLKHPEKHDVWVLNMGYLETQRKYQAQYRVAQVLQVSDTHVELLQGSFTYRKLRGAERAIKLDSLMLDSYFRRDTLTFKHSELAALFELQAIDSVYRPNDIYVLGGIVKRRARPTAINDKLNIQMTLNSHNDQAIILFRQGDFEAARAQFLQAAEQGDSWGQYNLAGMLEHAQGGSQDLQKAVYWLQQSAKQQNSKAQSALDTLCNTHPSVC
ncbi:tetratricopeptide repeat protein [Pseudoalteromonas sp. T1lg23B]|uniref:tetratricopeptide repeat protein n=1 Tax=Pseudoalteromonas sp. T1lg23B TaxID=2077097 RepID=UPI000CF5DAAF|nr:tetratricopeptide repeat protein [Pseudoalteromonas sp. T1lg23B]